jgi:hypothetical protein
MKVKRLQVALAVLGLLTAACGASSGGGTTGSAGLTGPTGRLTRGVALPNEVSALPTTGAAAEARAAMREVSRGLAAFGPDTDYAKAETFKFVNESSLSRFEILNTIFKAISQTHYDDPAVLGMGPYLAMVSWTEERGGQQVKQLVKWQVDSKIVQVDGVDANKVQVWFEQPLTDGAQRLIRVQLLIIEPPRMNADGVSYADYGKWSLVAAYDPGGGAYLAASADRDASGMSIVKIHEFYPPPRPGRPAWETKGILHRSSTAGAGRVLYPNTECPGLAPGEECQQTPTEISYVYDGSTVTMKDGSDPVVSKDRTRVVDLVNRYGLFDASTGATVVRNFGFPVLFQDAQGTERIGYYGAWQGRHQIWRGDPDNATLPRGTVVTRGDVAPGGTAPAFTTSGAYTGTLVKRDMLPASLAELTGIYLEINQVESFALYPDGTGGWCKKMVTGEDRPLDEARFSCATPDAVPFTDADFAAWLVDQPNGIPRYVAPAYWDEQALQVKVLVYAAAGAWGPSGLYEAEFSVSASNWTMKVPYTPFVLPAQSLELCVQDVDTIYVSWNGTAWVQKEFLSFDRSNWAPIVGPNDTPYTLELGREHYILGASGNFLVKRTEAGVEVQVEMQRVANPGNAATFLAVGTTFKEQYVTYNGVPSVFRFDTDERSASFMRLLYVTVGTYEPTDAVEGGPVTLRKLGLFEQRDGQPTGIQFNWDYPSQSQPGGIQEFLQDAGGVVLLDDPIRFASIPLANGAGETRHFQLQFDGNWIHGLPNLADAIRLAGFNASPELANKVVVVPDGTEVTDPLDGRSYVVKQLQIEEYLNPTDALPLDLSPAGALQLDTVPGYVAADPPMGEMDPNAVLRYSEGIEVR